MITTPSPPSVLLRVAASFGFAALTLVSASVLFAGFDFDETYGFITKTLVTLTYLLAIPSFLLVVFGLSRSGTLSAGVRAVTILTFLIVSPFIFGLLQGDSPSPVGVTQFWFLFAYSLVWMLPLISLISFAMLALGLVDEVRISRNSKHSQK